MSALVSRLLLTMLMFPLAAMVYLIIVVIGIEIGPRWSDNLVFMAGGLATSTFVAGYWMLLWARSVRWQPWRIGSTIGLTFGAAVAGVAASVIVVSATENMRTSFGIFVGTVIAPLLWLAGTILLWRETPAERTARLAASRDAVVCPTCGYNLTGLTSTRCPECGATLTLDALLRSQPTRTDLDRG